MKNESRIFGGLTAAFWAKRPLIGMVHLGPLPGSPRDAGGGAAAFEAVLDRAERDACALVEGGADAVMIENFFDAPFARDAVPPHTVAAMTRAVERVKAAAGGLPLGVNVLRNDARAALAVAHVCGARFVRINVFVGAAVTDQGVIEGAARTAVLYRRELGADVALWADVFVKHAAQLGGEQTTLEDAARDAVERGLADALIVSGTATGAATDPETAGRASRAVPGTPLLVGSGFDAQTATGLMAAGATGAIVGTALKTDGQVSGPVEASRVRALRDAMDAAVTGVRRQQG